jgi:superfamily II DNA or RNA helicase
MDRRVRPELDMPELSVHIPLWDYQVDAVEALVQHGRGVISCPPRSGKTRILCEVQRRLNLQTLWVAPTERIVTQTQRVLEGFFGQCYSVQLVGTAAESAAAHRKVVVCTNATASMLSDAFLATRQMWVVDEVHHGASDQLQDLGARMPHVFYRMGATGTFFRSGLDDLALHALLSNVVYQISASELLRQGHLVPVNVAILPVPTERLRRLPPTFHGGGHGTEGVHEHDLRNRIVAGVCVMLAQRGHRVLCLVGTISQGKILLDMLRRELPRSADPESPAVDFACSKVPDFAQERMLERFADGRLKVLIGTTLLGEGVDLPTADAMVLARGEQAEVSLTQAIYRVCTAVAGKSRSILIDFDDQHHPKLAQHAAARLAVYRAEPIFHVDLLGALEHLPLWLDSLGAISGAHALQEIDGRTKALALGPGLQ